MKLKNLLATIPALETIAVYIKKDVIKNVPYWTCEYFGNCSDFRATTEGVKKDALLEQDVEKVNIYNGSLSIWLV